MLLSSSLDRQTSACPCSFQLVQPRSGLLPGSQPSCCHFSPLSWWGVGLLVHCGCCGAHHAQGVLHQEPGRITGWSEGSEGTAAHESPSCGSALGDAQVRLGGGYETHLCGLKYVVWFKGWGGKVWYGRNLHMYICSELKCVSWVDTRKSSKSLYKKVYSKPHSVLLVEIAVCMEYSRGPQARWKWQSTSIR